MFVKAQLTRPRPVARRKYFNILNYHQGAAPAAPTEPQDAVPPYPAGRRYSWDMVPDAAGLMRDAALECVAEAEQALSIAAADGTYDNEAAATRANANTTG